MLRLFKAADIIHENAKDRWEDDSAQRGLRESKTSDFICEAQANCASKTDVEAQFSSHQLASREELHTQDSGERTPSDQNREGGLDEGKVDEEETEHAFN